MILKIPIHVGEGNQINKKKGLCSKEYYLSRMSLIIMENALLAYVKTIYGSKIRIPLPA